MTSNQAGGLVGQLKKSRYPLKHEEKQPQQRLQLRLMYRERSFVYQTRTQTKVRPPTRLIQDLELL